MKYYKFYWILFSLTLSFYSFQIKHDNLKSQISELIKFFIEKTKEKPMYGTNDGIKLVYVLVICETDDTIKLSINFESDPSHLPYIDPNFIMKYGNENIFVRAIQISDSTIERLHLTKFNRDEQYVELERLSDNKCKEVLGINYSYFIEIKNDTIITKKYIPAEDIEGDLWLYDSDYTKSLPK